MADQTTGVLLTQKFSAILETTEGTAVAETAAAAVTLSVDGGFEPNIDRELIESQLMTGSFSGTAPQAGMWSDDIGGTVNGLMRGKGSLTQPDWSVFMNSVMGAQNQNSDGVIDALSTTTTIIIKSGGDPQVGQLVYFPEQAWVARVIDVTAGTSFDIDVWLALPATPTADDTFICGTNWQLASEGHPSFTTYSYYDGPKRLRFAGNKTVSAEFIFETGQVVPMKFTNKALTPLYDNTAQSVTPAYDDNTVPLRCLEVTLFTMLSGTAQGTPTTIGTVLTTPAFDVDTGDKLLVDVGSGVWETVLISGATGDAGSNITLVHAALSAPATAGETVYILRDRCATTGSSITMNIEMEAEAELCMQASSGMSGRKFTARKVTFSKNPYFKSWQQFLMRDGVVGSSFMITLGSDLNNIVSIYVPNEIVTEASLTSDSLMMVDTTTQAVIDSVLGNDNEVVVAAF